MQFPFEMVYDKLAKSLDGKDLTELPFGPYYLREKVVDGDVYVTGFSPLDFILNFFLVEGGQEKLYELTKKELADSDDDQCAVLAHEGHFKIAPDAAGAALEAMKDKGLSQDPNAQHAVVIIVFHKSGQRMGFCPIDANRVVSYGPMEKHEEQDIYHVKIGADQTCH